MSLKCKGVFIVGAKRTPFCKLGGHLRGLPASQAFAAASKGAIQSANIDPTLIDGTVVGNVHFLSQCDGGKTARYCGLYSGVPIERPALCVNRTCGSGLKAVISGAVDLMTGALSISLTGGTEIMSSLPFLVRNVRYGTALGSNYKMEDYMPREFTDSFTGLSLERIAENLAKKFAVARDEVDEYAAESYLKWKAAQENNVFQDELTSIIIKIKNEEINVNRDDAKPTTVEELKKMPTLLDNGSVISYGNRADPADGAAALLLAHEDALKQHNLKPLARITGWSCTGVHPDDTGTAAVTAVKNLLKSLDVETGEVDLFEINETFAAQALVAAKLLDLDPMSMNKCGGAVALGHPVAATGARMVTHLVHQLRRQNLKRAVAASNCGGGQGIAIMLEQV